MLEMIDLPRATHGNTTYVQRAQAVRARYDALPDTQKQLRARELAKALDISESEWVAAQCGPLRSIRLGGPPQHIFKGLGALGRVMALTRNESCVHERHGQYLNTQTEGPVGLVLGPDIDLRVFFETWTDTYAVQQGERCSVQFFDQAGLAVHKVFCTELTDINQYVSLVQQFAQPSSFSVPVLVKKDTLPQTVQDVEGFRKAWLAMIDTHDFFVLLKKFNVTRLGALAQAGSDLAQEIQAQAVEQMLHHVAAEEISLMCFVANRGMIQIHTGPIKTVARLGVWLNVLDPSFNLHLNTAHIKQVWVVNKPTIDGWVTSLEVFDHQDELIVQFFGARKPGQPELSAWRQQLTSFCPQPLLG